jgi:hypothetical protein
MNKSAVPNSKCNGVPPAMRWRLAFILLTSTVLSVNLSAVTIVFQESANGSTAGSTGSYEYEISGFDFLANAPCVNPIDSTATLCSDELDINFNPAVFSAISNGVASGGVAPFDWSLILFQPNNPPLAQGDYSALAEVNNASLAGIFSVAFTLTGGTSPLAPPFPSQSWSISQFDSNPNDVNGNGVSIFGNFEGTLASGNTVNSVPEPSSFMLSGTALVLALAVLMCRLSLRNGFDNDSKRKLG